MPTAQANAVKERPIIFSAHSVQGIQSGLKKQTRRVVKPQPSEGYGHTSSLMRRPYEIGQKLWVKEAWRVVAWNPDYGRVYIEYKAGGCTQIVWLDVPDSDTFTKLWIESTDDAAKAGLKCDADGEYRWPPGAGPARWRSPLFMYRWASRITLEITKVRIERIQEIDNGDLLHEAGPQVDVPNSGDPWADFYDAVELPFRKMWDELNAKRGYSWEANPWVFVLEFKNITNGINP